MPFLTRINFKENVIPRSEKVQFTFLPGQEEFEAHYGNIWHINLLTNLFPNITIYIYLCILTFFQIGEAPEVDE